GLFQMNADGSCEGAFAPSAGQLMRPLWRPGSMPGLGPIQCVDLRLSPLPSGGYAGPTGLGQNSSLDFSIENDGDETATGVRVEVKIMSSPGKLVDPPPGCTSFPTDLSCRLDPIPARTKAMFRFATRSPV